jgi:hypothetical protein
MKATHRLTLVGTVLGSIVIFFLALTYFSRGAEGPLARVLTEIGIAVGEFENQVIQRFRGPAREAELTWFKPYRSSSSYLLDPDFLLLGAYDSRIPRSLEGIVDLENAIGTTFPLIHFYSAWGDKADQQFPIRMVQAVWNLGSVPVLTWEPWLTDFEEGRHSHIPARKERDKGGLASIAGGDYDFYVDIWAADAAKFGKPFFLRFGHEMNDPYRYPWGPHNNSIEDFIRAWRHVVERFRMAGADNVVWVWSPHASYDFYPYYPGDDYIDWVATGVLNFGTVAYWSKWWTFKEIFGDKYEFFAALNKPIMIAEFGSLAVGGDRSAWFQAALQDFQATYPQVKALLFFHSSSDATVTYQNIDWSFATDSTVADMVARAILPWPLPHDSTTTEPR